MHRRPPLLLGLLACLVASSAWAEASEWGNIEFQPLLSLDSPLAAEPPASEAIRTPASPNATTPPPSLDVEPKVEPAKPIPLDGFLGYRYESNSMDWMLGGDDRFGMFSLRWDHYQSPGVKSGLDGGMQFHFLNGPVRTDMPDRVYDFSLGYQARDQLGAFSYDVAAAVMASSDFQGSARDGIRFPSHAVGFLSLNPSLQLVFGVDYLDRGDVKLLPVAGLIVLPCANVRLEAIFPRPRVVFQLTEECQLYVGGELGGDSWAIERVSGVSELVTYRDLRVCMGLQHWEDGGGYMALEIGYLFDRRLEYASGLGDYQPDDTAMIRLVRTY